MNDVHDLLGAYCTDSLDPQERADFEIHLQGCAGVPGGGGRLP